MGQRWAGFEELRGPLADPFGSDWDREGHANFTPSAWWGRAQFQLVYALF